MAAHRSGVIRLLSVFAMLLFAVALGAQPGTARAAVSASTLAAPSGDAFYTPPSPLPSGSPGDVIWYRTATSPVSGADSWQILYLTTNANGTPTAVSGTVLVPTTAYSGSGPRPLVAYAPGTQGWGFSCAPSVEMASNNFDEQFEVNNLLGRGWAVVVTDYPGLGTPGPEEYNVGIPEGYAVLDSLRAALRLSADGLSPGAPTAIMGYSQGGGAGGWAAQLAASYAPDLNLKGVAIGGTPANLQDVANNINGSTWFAFLAGTAEGFNTAYPSLDLQSELTSEGQTAMAQLETMCQAQALITYAGKSIQDYTVGGINPMTQPDWETVLNKNNLGGIKPDVPILETHGYLDEIIPYSVEQTLHSQWCADGVADELIGYAGDHILTAVEDQTDTDNWIADRFAGNAAPNNC
jgi:pimeloyl-ACP methyl ester carboxylesterase